MKILRSDKRIHCLFHYTYTLHSEIWQKRVIFFEVFACLTRQNQTEISFFKQVLYPSSYLKIHPPKHPTTLMPRAKCFWAFSPRVNRNKNNVNTAREHGSAKTIPLLCGKCENPKSGKETGRFCLYCCIFAF